jgi:uncharacterized membrane protein
MQKNNDDDQTEETVQHLATLYDEHNRSASPIQRLADRVTGALSRPAALAVLLLLIILWIVGNYVARYVGSTAFEELPFPDLAFFATVAAFLVTILILTTQRHENALAEKRAHLTLQIAVISEKKIAKIIALIEEQRRDNPLLGTRIDNEAEQMAKTADQQASRQQVETVWHKI